MRRLILPLLLLATPAPAHAWNAMGHRLVARVAQEYLSGDTRKLVRRLLEGGSLAGVANWADSIRPTRPATAPWHFLNLPVGAAWTGWEAYCPPEGCIVRSLEDQLAILGDRKRPDSERAVALRFVVHFIGDLHQPLHVSNRDDRGGNDLPVTWNGRTTNLHDVWDARLINSTGLDEARWFGRLRKALRHQDRRKLGAGSIGEWAQEGHRLAAQAYRLPSPPELGSAYVADNLPRAELQLLRAGVRLAELLNRTLGK